MKEIVEHWKKTFSKTNLLSVSASLRFNSNPNKPILPQRKTPFATPKPQFHDMSAQKKYTKRTHTYCSVKHPFCGNTHFTKIFLWASPLRDIQHVNVCHCRVGSALFEN